MKIKPNIRLKEGDKFIDTSEVDIVGNTIDYKLYYIVKYVDYKNNKIELYTELDDDNDTTEILYGDLNYFVSNLNKNNLKKYDKNN